MTQGSRYLSRKDKILWKKNTKKGHKCTLQDEINDSTIMIIKRNSTFLSPSLRFRRVRDRERASSKPESPFRKTGF